MYLYLKLINIIENCEKSINEFFDCEEEIHKSPWVEKDKISFIKDQKEKRVFLYKLLKDKLLNKIKGKDNKFIKILEIGPAEGIIARMLRNDGYDLNLLEYEQDGEKTVPSEKYYPNINTSFCEFNKKSFPFENESFDLVISFGVIEHQEPPTFHFWSEMHRVLKTSGLLFIDNPNPHNLRKRIYKFLGLDENFDIKYFYNQKFLYFTGHYREHSKNELIYCLKDKMELVDSGYFPFITFAKKANSSLSMRTFLVVYDLICRIFRSNLDTVYVIGKK